VTTTRIRQNLYFIQQTGEFASTDSYVQELRLNHSLFDRTSIGWRWIRDGLLVHLLAADTSISAARLEKQLRRSIMGTFQLCSLPRAAVELALIDRTSWRALLFSASYEERLRAHLHACGWREDHEFGWVSQYASILIEVIAE
jgi:hypothetical protein